MTAALMPDTQTALMDALERLLVPHNYAPIPLAFCYTEDRWVFYAEFWDETGNVIFDIEARHVDPITCLRHTLVQVKRERGQQKRLRQATNRRRL